MPRRRKADNWSTGQYEVLRVLDKFVIRGLTFYLVKWADSDTKKWSADKYDNWVRDDLMDCPDLILEFERRKKQSPEKDKHTGSSSKRRISNRRSAR